MSGIDPKNLKIGQLIKKLSVTLEPVDRFSSFWGLFHSKFNFLRLTYSHIWLKVHYDVHELEMLPNEHSKLELDKKLIFRILSTNGTDNKSMLAPCPNPYYCRHTI